MYKDSYKFIIFAILWLLLSGHYTTFLLILGISSLLFTVIYTTIIKRAIYPNLIFHYPLHKLYKYILMYLAKEIIISNINIFKCILFSNYQPQIIKIDKYSHSDQNHASLDVILANSITLTPGTITVSEDQQFLYIHAFNKDVATSLLDTQGIKSRVKNIVN